MKSYSHLRRLSQILTIFFIAIVATDLVFAQVSVRGYYRKDGTYVRPHQRTKPDSNPYNNYSFPGNYNPNTGKITTGNPSTYLRNYYNRSSSSTSNRVWVEGYFRKDGTYVNGHYRTKPDRNPYNNYSYPGNYNPNTDRITSYSRNDSRNNLNSSSSSRFYSELNSHYSKYEIMNIQKKLKYYGYDPGPADGIIGPKTLNAIDRYNADKEIDNYNIPANATVLGNSWYCDNGYKKVGNHCEEVSAPDNASVFGSSWYCDNGYKKVGNHCEKVNAPANATVFGSSWFCDNGYKKVGNHCKKVNAPANAIVFGSSWYCNNGFKRVGQKCVRNY